MAEYSNAQDYQNEGADVQVHSEDDFIATDCTSNTPTNADDSLPRCWQKDHKTLTASMHEVYKNKLWTDMTIHCGVNQEKPLQAHKIILAARSPVFEAMLFGPCSDQKSEYTFDEANRKTFDKLLRFLYNDDVEFSDTDEAIELMKAALKYQITSLENFCVHYLKTNITLEDACKILDIAIKFNKMDLKESCCHFIDRNADDVLQSDEFLNISPECLKYILKGDTFFAKEDVIFYQVEEWAKHSLTQTGKEENKQNMRNAIGDVMHHIRLPSLQNVEDILNCTRGKGYLETTELQDIFDCHTGNISQSSFMSDIPRITPNPATNLLNNSKSIGDTNCKSVCQTLNVRVKRNMYLKTVSMPYFGVFLQYSNSLYISNNDCNSKPIDGQLLPKCLPITLHVTVTVKQLKFKERFQVEQKQQNLGSVLTLSKPLLLEKQQRPYELEIDIRIVGGNSSFKLVVEKGTVEQSFDQYAKKEYNSVYTAETTMLGIDHIEFTNCSLRENDDNTSESESGDGV